MSNPNNPANSIPADKRRLGTAMVLAASLCFSTGGLLMKLIPWNPLAINGVRNAISSVVIGLYILATHHRIKFNPTVLVGAISMAGVTTLYSIANKLTTAGNTIILQYTAPIWIVILMYLFFGKKPNRTALISILIVFVGILCFFLEGLSSGKWLGDLLALLSGVCYAGVFMLNSFEKGDALSSVFFGQLACGVFMSPFVLPGQNIQTRSRPPSSTRWSRSSIRSWSRSSTARCSADCRWSERSSSSAGLCIIT